MGERMQRIFEGFDGFGGEMQPIGVAPFVVVMLVALAASIFIAYLYLYFYSSRATGSHVQRSFPLLGLSVTAIFVCVQFSLPLSLGLLGALSIVRFRTPVKEPEEIGFIMLIIAASLACATLNFGFLVVILAVAVAALVLRRWAPALLEGTTHDGSLVAAFSATTYRERGDELLELVERGLARARIESISRHDDEVVLSVLFHGTDSRALRHFEEELGRVAEPSSLTILFNRPGRL
ncbi:MAG: DUF4956 domain-containing protein [Thermoanaerobaculia bacterium]|nr:DUF4956 domain-containing protein [Thermoanaerobaculia bacterium]